MVNGDVSQLQPVELAYDNIQAHTQSKTNKSRKTIEEGGKAYVCMRVHVTEHYWSTEDRWQLK